MIRRSVLFSLFAFLVVSCTHSQPTPEEKPGTATPPSAQRWPSSLKDWIPQLKIRDVPTWTGFDDKHVYIVEPGQCRCSLKSLIPGGAIPASINCDRFPPPTRITFQRTPREGESPGTFAIQAGASRCEVQDENPNFQQVSKRALEDFPNLFDGMGVDTTQLTRHDGKPVTASITDIRRMKHDSRIITCEESSLIEFQGITTHNSLRRVILQRTEGETIRYVDSFSVRGIDFLSERQRKSLSHVNQGRLLRELAASQQGRPSMEMTIVCDKLH